MKLSPLLGVISASSPYHNPHYSPGHDGFVQLFEWRWSSIASECENFLGPFKFGGVQLSPPNENKVWEDKGRPWYERYQPVSYELETRSGSRVDFIDMVNRCNAAGVRIYVDAVINHMTGKNPEQGTGTGGSNYDAKNKSYPTVPYDSTHFNPDRPCWDENDPNYIDENNKELREKVCPLHALSDLDQGQEYVRDKIVGYMNDLIDIGVAGFRIDAAQHMYATDLEVIYSRLNNLSVGQGKYFIYTFFNPYKHGRKLASQKTTEKD